MSVVGGILQGVAAIQQGNAAAEAGQARQNELNIDAQNTQIAAKQAQSSRLDQLQKTVGTIRATVASRALDLNSPSAMALIDNANVTTQRDIARGRFNAWQNSSNAIMAGQQARISGDAARTAGYLSGAGQFLKAGAAAGATFAAMP